MRTDDIEFIKHMRVGLQRLQAMAQPGGALVPNAGPAGYRGPSGQGMANHDIRGVVEAVRMMNQALSQIDMTPDEPA